MIPMSYTFKMVYIRAEQLAELENSRRVRVQHMEKAIEEYRTRKWKLFGEEKFLHKQMTTKDK